MKENLQLLYLEHQKIELKAYSGFCHRLAFETAHWIEETRKQDVGIRYVWRKGLEDAERFCFRANELLHPWNTPALQVSYPKGPPEWKFHCVVTTPGFVHDAWLGRPIPLGAYLKMMFPKNSENVQWSRFAPCESWQDSSRWSWKRPMGKVEVLL